MAFVQYYFIAEPASQTVAQYWANIGVLYEQ